jgi:hypothetical protein
MTKCKIDKEVNKSGQRKRMNNNEFVQKKEGK